MNAWHSIKDHPWLTGAAVGVVLLFLVFRGSGGSASPGAATTSDPGADALASAQLQAQTQIAGYSAAATASAAHDQSGIELATIASKSNDFANSLAAEVALSNIGAGADVQKKGLDVTDNANTLAAGVAMNGQNQETARQSIQSGAQVQTTEALANALTTNAAFTAQTQQAQIWANSSVMKSYIDANSCSGWFC